MSTQTSQFLMWGIQLPYAWHKEWEKTNPGKGGDIDSFYTHFEPFITDNAHDEKMPAHNDGIMCLYDGRDGRYIIIGRILAYASSGCMIGDDKPVVVKPLTTLEQELIRNSEGYKPGNCKWATAFEQHKNKRTNRHLTVGRTTKVIAHWTRKTGVKRNTILRRLRNGASPAEAIRPNSWFKGGKSWSR